MSSIDELENDLATATDRRDQAIKALAAKHRGGEREEYRAAHAAVLTLERQLAAARGEEHAVPLDFPVRWDIGAPLPHLLQNDSMTLLIFYVREPHPAWDGSHVTVTNPASARVESLALVEFRGCMSAKFGSPNDEVFSGHALYGRGLEAYTAQRVVNSRWLAELEATNRVHRRYDPAFWREQQHFVFWFHDTTFDCVAESFSVELHRDSLAGLLERACDRLLRRK